jgi:hypothetical protein
MCWPPIPEETVIKDGKTVIKKGMPPPPGKRDLAQCD